jgi:hypothetical protein
MQRGNQAQADRRKPNSAGEQAGISRRSIFSGTLRISFNRHNRNHGTKPAKQTYEQV